jgi:Pectate lyase superfamily protein
VAILQISRITQRKGLAQDLPAPLDGAELGWAIDDRKLYIGNGTLDEGAPVVGNTEVLTEYSDLLSYTTGYTYNGDAAGYTVQTGATTGSPISQSLQNRLDSYAVITDFGATGDGVTDDTAAINRALYQLYCRQTNTQVRRSLFFPAGTYLVTNTILVPPFAQLYGEGADSSIISFQVNNWVTLTAYAVNTMVYYATNGNYYRSAIAVPPEDPATPGTQILPTNTTYWTAHALPEFVVQTVDSLQQASTNIGTNGATAPQNIEISNMSFQTGNSGNDSSVSHNIMLIDRAARVTINNVTLRGPFTTADYNTTDDDMACVKFGSAPSLPCVQINFSNCKFTGATYGINTDKDITGATVSGCYFDTLYQGVVLESDTVSSPNTSPTGVRIVENIFDNIYHEAIVISGPTLNASAYNIFYDVGNIFL